jgi:hypothetical protein
LDDASWGVPTGGEFFEINTENSKLVSINGSKMPAVSGSGIPIDSLPEVISSVLLLVTR